MVLDHELKELDVTENLESVNLLCMEIVIGVKFLLNVFINFHKLLDIPKLTIAHGWIW